MKKISFIFPVYNEVEVIEVFYREISEAVKQIEKQYSVEMVFVNDGSDDGTLEKLVSIQQKDDRVKVINFSRNFGHQMAITAGLDYTSGDAVIIIDSDLQDPPIVCLELIKKWEEGFEVVYAQRKSRKDAFFKQLTASIFYRILDRLANINIPPDTADFRLVDKKVSNEMKKFREKNRFMRGLFSYVGFKQTAVLYDRNERFAGKTKYPFGKMMKLAIDGITGFSTFPLRIITQIGFLVSFLSFVGIIYALFMRFFFSSITVSGWTFMIISIFFIGGVQMMMLGIIGNYIGRIYDEVKGRPLYIVSSVLGKEKIHIE